MNRLTSIFLSLLVLVGISAVPITNAFAATTAATNLIANPLVATPSTTNSAMPANWLQGNWGTNSTTFSYLNTGYNDSNSVEVAMNSYTSGDAKWYFTPVTVSPSTSYTYTDEYESTVATDVVAQLENASGALTYLDLGAAPAASTWTQYAENFTTSSDTTNVTIFHLIESVGTLTTDDFSLTTAVAATPPPVVTPPPTTGNLVENPGFETAASTTMPADWNEGGWGTNTANFTYLNTGHTGSHSAEVAITKYTSGDAKWYFNPVNVTPGTVYNFSDYYESNIASDVMVQYESTTGTYSYVDLGSAAASTTWKEYTGSFTVPAGTANATVFHLISAVGTLTTDDYSVEAAPVAVGTTVSITSPTTNSKVTGITTLVASAANAKSVQFEMDGTKIGSPVTTSPYQLSWDSTTAVDGSHSLIAVATNSNGATVTSTAVPITVDNYGSNMIPNPQAKIAASTTPVTPLDWTEGGWGTNTATFAYTTGGYGGSDDLKISMTKYTSGDEKWMFPNETPTPDVQYNFTDYYESSVSTEVDAVFNLSDGTTDYQIIGLPSAATTWTKFSSDFVVPQDTTSMTVYQLIEKVGTLSTSDYSMTPYTPVGFNRALVSLTFDDGYSSTYTYATPILDANGFKSTQFIITDQVGTTGYMTDANVKSLYADGQEIASHTITHDDMTTETAATLKNELSESQSTLAGIIGAPVTDMAYPYGEYNTAVQAETKDYYTGARGVEDGLNSKDNFNAMDLKVQNIYNTTTTAQVADWVAQAQATNTWLIFVYHSVDPDTTSDIDGGIYNVTPTQLTDQLAAIKASGVVVETMKQALAEVTPQL
jgi:peptidoglycan/xylan/chitin deacetylase (PgdA/CDA1 family)